MSVTGKPLLVPGVGKVSGSVASFADSNGKPLRSCIVTMEPIRSGTGNPSPDNIRPISGRTACSVYSTRQSMSFSSPLTITRDDETTLTVASGTLDTATGELTDNATPPNTYNLSRTEVARAVEALGVAPVTVQLGRTVYGGMANMVSGELIVNRVIYTLSSSQSWSSISSGASKYFQIVIETRPIQNAERICSHFGLKSITSTTTTVGFGINIIDGIIRIAVRPETDARGSVSNFKAWLDAQKDAGTPVQVCFERAEPLIYQLTPAQVATVLGANSVWSPDGGAAAEYYKKSMLFIR